MKLKVFISSPGDVAREREIARRIFKRIERRYAGKVEIEPYLWEHEPLHSSSDFQGNVPPTSSFDLVVCILWTRLGTRLGSHYLKADGSRYESGTEYEVLTTIDAQNQPPVGLPVLSVYLNQTGLEVRARGNDLEATQKRLLQFQMLQEFVTEWFFEQEGDKVLNKRAYNGYETLDQFEDLLTKQLITLVDERLEDQLDAGGATSPAVVPDASWQGNPYRGLEVFEFKHAPIMYGRTRATEAVLNALKSRTEAGCGFVLVLGSSGTGKSSLVRAGVLPLLIQPGVMEGVGIWRRAIMTPGRAAGDAMDALAAALLDEQAFPGLAPENDPEPGTQLAAELRTMPEMVVGRMKDELNAAAQKWLVDEQVKMNEFAMQLETEGRDADAASLRQQCPTVMPPRTQLALVVDQFEELFTSSIPMEARVEFVRVIDSLARSGDVVVIATMRSDFYASYQQHPILVNLAGETGRVDLSPPQPHEIGQMIRGPAESAGLQFEKHPETKVGLDEELRDAAVESPEGLPLLEHVLKQLYERQERRSDGWLRWEDYYALGEFSGALSRHADEVLEGLGGSAEEVLDDVLENLITVGVSEESKAVRRTARYDRLAEKRAHHRLVDAFVNARLFVAGSNEKGERTVSVAHEALLRVWPKITEWVEENRDFLQMRARLETARKAWEAAEEHPDFLLDQGRPLAEAEELLAKYGTALREVDRRFIHLSSVNANRLEIRKRRIRRTVLAGMTALAVVALGFGVFARKKGIEAERERIASEEKNLTILAGNAKSALEARRLGDAALWSAALIEAKRDLGVDHTLDDLRLLALQPGLDLFKWRLPSNDRITQIVPRQQGKFVFLNVDSKRLLRGTPGDDETWQIDEVGASWGQVMTIAALDQGEERRILLAVTKDKLRAVEADTMKVRWEYEPGEGDLSPALTVEANRIWIWEGGKLLVLNPDGAVAKSYGLGLPNTARVYGAVIDPEGEIAFAVVNRHRLAWNFESREELLKESHQSGWSPGYLARDGENVVLIENDNREDSLVFWDLKDLTQATKVDTKWDIMSIYRAGKSELEAVCSDGAVRSWNWDGKFLKTTRMPESDGTRSVAEVGENIWVAGDELTIHSTLDHAPEHRQGWWRQVKQIQKLSEGRMLLLTRRGIEIRAVEDGSLILNRAMDLDEFLVAEDAELFFGRNGDILAVYRLGDVLAEGDSPPQALARVHNVGEGPLVFDPDRSQIALPYNGGYQMFDAETLSRRQRILDSIPVAAAMDPGGNDLWIANLDEARGRMEIFVHRETGNMGSLYHLVHPENLTSASFQFSGSKWLLLGYKDGSAQGLDVTLRSSHGNSLVIPEQFVSEISPPGNKEVTSIHSLPNAEFLVVRKAPSLSIYQRDDEGDYFEKRVFQPFAGSPGHVLPMDGRTLVAESNGELVKFQLGQSMSVAHFAEDVGSQSTGFHAFCTKNGVVYPKDRTVNLLRANAGPLTLYPGKMSPDSFVEVFVGPNEDVILAIDGEAVVAWSMDGEELSGKRFFDPGEHQPPARQLPLPMEHFDNVNFLSPRTFAAAFRAEFWEIEVPTNPDTELKVLRQWRPDFNENVQITSVAKSGDFYGVADETNEREVIFRIAGTPDQPEITPIPLSAVPTSLAVLDQEGHILVGAMNEVFVVNLSEAKMVRRIELPIDSEDNVEIEGIAPIPGTAMVLIGGEQRIYAVDWQASQFITEFPVYEYVYSIHVDAEQNKARWVGGKCYGLVDFPDFTADAPSMEALQAQLGLSLEGGEIHHTNPPIRLPKTDSAAPCKFNASNP